MRRRSNIDLTPMLDVILLLVFGFMFVLAATNTQLIDSQQTYTEQSQVSTKAIERLTAENAELQQQVQNLTQAQQAQAQMQDVLASGIARHYQLNERELDALLKQQDQTGVTAYLTLHGSTADVAQSMVMYQLMANEFYFVEIVLKGDDNRIWINDVATPVQIAFEDVATHADEADKKAAIKAEISNVIDSRQGGSAMVFVTLATNNVNVYHYAWALTWQAVTELEEKYGASDYYSAELFIKED